MPIPNLNPKLIGEIAELEFHSRCARLGLRSTRGIGESYPYDAIVDNRHSMLRVQIKGTVDLGCNGLFQVHCGHSVYGKGIVPYEEGEIDLFAFYLLHINTWYFAPLSATDRRLSVTLYAPDRRHEGKYAQYFEAWHLLEMRKPCPICRQTHPDSPSSQPLLAAGDSSNETFSSVPDLSHQPAASPIPPNGISPHLTRHAALRTELGLPPLTAADFSAIPDDHP